MTENYVIGVDIGGTSVKLGFFTGEGELIHKFEIKTRREQKGKQVLPDIAAAIKDKQAELQLQKDALIGVGVGIPGAVRQDGMVIKCANLGWEMKDAASEFSQLLGGVKVCVGNDANAAALGEIWKGVAQGCQSGVMVTLGTGVGGGIISNGQIISGFTGSGGEIGHMHLVDDGRPCGCGESGCLEQYASATGIEKTAELLMHGSYSCREVFEFAKEGNEAAIQVVDDMADKLGRALSMIACVVDPQVFIIGGGVSAAGDFLIEKVRARYRSYAFFAIKDTAFVQAKLGNDAGIYGAAKLVLNS